MQQIALAWLVYRLTDSVWLLGVVGFSTQIPVFVLAPFAGVIADRHHRHRLLLLTQTAAMLQAVILAVLVVTNTITVWQIIALGLFMGLINAFDIPVRQSFTADLVSDDHADLGNAIALNSSMVNAARLIGPSIGGILIATAGESVCFILNALSYVGVLGSLLAMRIPQRELPGRKNPWHELKEGVHYTFSFMPIRTILMLLSFVSLIGWGSQILMPVFARDILHGGAQMLGFLMGSVGLGATAGAMYLASRKSVLGLGRIIVVACFLYGLGMIGFALVPVFWVSMVMLMLAGFGMIVHMAASNTILQSMVQEDKRGRVMSFYTMAFTGVVPLGNLMAGSLAHDFGAPVVYMAGGLCIIASGVLFASQLPRLRELVRPLYIEKGILSEIVH